MVKVEVCIDSVTSAETAIKSGCHRLEVCGPLSCGGTTPSLGLVSSVDTLIGRLCALDKVTFRVMLRSRDGDFFYNAEEKAVMLADAKFIMALNLSSAFEGFVAGALTVTGNVDLSYLEELPLRAVRGNTFHRACDVLSTSLTSSSSLLEALIRMKFDTVLTSGKASTCIEGLPEIVKMALDVQTLPICIMPGAGLNAMNIEIIFAAFAAQNIAVEWVHTSGSTPMFSTLRPEKGLFTEWVEVSDAKIRALVEKTKLRNGDV